MTLSHKLTKPLLVGNLNVVISDGASVADIMKLLQNVTLILSSESTCVSLPFYEIPAVGPLRERQVWDIHER